MDGEDGFDFSGASVEDSLRRLNAQTQATDADTANKQSQIRSIRHSTPSMGGLNPAMLAGLQGLGEAIGAKLGGAEAVTGASPMATGDGAATYGGTQQSSVLPGILPGAAAGSGAQGATGIFGGSAAGAAKQGLLSGILSKLTY